MTIINKLIPIINTYNPAEPSISWTENHPSGALTLRDRAKFEHDFWYGMFSCEHSFRLYKIKDLVDEPTLQRILNKEAFLVLDNSLEPFERSIDSIYEHIVKDGIPASQIILLTNMYDAKSYSDDLAKKLNQEPIKIFWYNIFEQMLQSELLYTVYKNTYQPKTLELKDYPKKFLNFNRRWRLHRPFLITLLYGKKLLDNGYVSFGRCEKKDSWRFKWPELVHYFRDDLKMLELLESSKDVTEMPPLYLDTEELHINRAVSTIDTNKYYEETYFSVISETTYFTKDWYHSARFLSEKAFKAIAMKHPFILVSVPNSLEIYKIMGYKTFSSIIDESYDTEPDDGKRMLMIVKEIERLCNLNKDELEKFILSAKEICEYNYSVLLSKKTFLTEL